MFFRQLLCVCLMAQLACGPETKKLRTPEGALKNVAGSIDGTTGGDADSTLNEELDRIMRAIRDGDAFLQQMIEKVDADAKLRDEELNQKILNLTTDVESFRKDIGKKIEALEQADKDIEARANQKIEGLKSFVENENKLLREEVAQLRTDWEASRDEATADRAAIRAEIDQKINDLRDELTQQIEELQNSLSTLDARIDQTAAASQAATTALKTNLESQISSLNTSLRNQITSENTALRTALTESITKLTDRLDYVEKNYATKAELTEAVESIDADLRAAINAAEERLRRASAQDVAQVRADFDAKLDVLNKRINDEVAGLNDRIDSTKSALENAISNNNAVLASTLRAEMKAMQTNLEALVEQKSDMLNNQIGAVKAELQQRIVDEVAGLQTRINAVEEFTKSEIEKLRGEITSAVTEAEQRINDATEEQIVAIRAEFNGKIATMNDTINREVAALGSRLDQSKADLLAAIQSGDEQNANALRAEMRSIQEDLNQAINDKSAMLASDIAKVDESLRAKISTEVEQLNGKIASVDEVAKAAVADLQAEMILLKGTMDDQLTALSAALRDAIQQGDKDLEDLLRTQIDGVKGEINQINTELEANKNATISQLAAQKADLLEKIADSEKKLQAAQEAQKAELMAAISALSSRISKVENSNESDRADLAAKIDVEFQKAKELLGVEIANRLVDAEDKLNEEFDTYKLEVEEKLKEQRVELESQMVAMRNWAVQTFATQKDLEDLRKVADGLQTTVDAMGRTISANDKAILELRDSDNQQNQALVGLLNFKDRASSDILALDRRVNDVEKRLTDHINEYKDNLALAQKYVDDSIAAVRTSLTSSFTADRDALQEELKKLQDSTVTKAYLDQVRGELSAKIVSLEGKDEELAKKLRDLITEQQTVDARQSEDILKLFDVTKQAQESADKALQVAKGAADSFLALEARMSAAESNIANLKTTFENYKKEVGEELGELREMAESIANDLGPDLKQQLANAVARIAELENRDVSTLTDFCSQIGMMINDASFDVDGCVNKLKTSNNDLVLSYNDLGAVMMIIESEFINSLNTVSNLKDNLPIIQSFQKDVIGDKSVCPGIVGLNEQDGSFMPSVNGMEWYKHLGRIYVRLLMTAARTTPGNLENDRIYFDFGSVAPTDSIQYFALQSLVPEYANGTNESCMSKIRLWAGKVLADATPSSKWVRDSVVVSVPLKKAVTQILPSAWNAIAQYSTAAENAVVAVLKDRKKTDAEIKKLLTSGVVDSKGQTKFMGLKLQTALLVAERAEHIIKIMASRANYQKIVDLAKQIAGVQDDLYGTKIRVTKLEASVLALQQKLDVFAARTEERLNKLEAGLGKTLSLFVALAGRLGYKDLVEAGKDALTEFGGMYIKNYEWPVTCMATARSYVYTEAFTDADAGRRPRLKCDSSIYDRSGSVIDDDDTSCRATENIVQTTNVERITANTTVVKTTNSTVTERLTTNVVNTGTSSWRNFVDAKVLSSVAMYAVYRGADLLKIAGGYELPAGVPKTPAEVWTTKPSVTLTTTKTSNTVINTSSQTSSNTTVSYSSFIEGAKVFGTIFPLTSPVDQLAMTLRLRQAGQYYADRLSTPILNIFGNAGFGGFIRITDVHDPSRTVTLPAENYESRTTPSGILYTVPSSMFMLSKDGAIGYTNMVKVEMLAKRPDGKLEQRGNICTHTSSQPSPKLTYLNTSTSKVVNTTVKQVVNIDSFVYRNFTTYHSNGYIWAAVQTTQAAGQGYLTGSAHYKSPIVLNLAGEARVDTIQPRESNARFDIDADGRADAIGWIRGKDQGFLALDVNRNGMIDNGSELFGNFSANVLGQVGQFTNGYEALAQHDVNQDRRIDSKDSIYHQLVVWRDQNENGVTDPFELSSLVSESIASISVDYTDLSHDPLMQGDIGISENHIPFSAKFAGPAYCPDSGCSSFDVYFGRENGVWLLGSNP
jgi:chromosome segregation ATPase